jgi:hypothetical protein
MNYDQKYENYIESTAKMVDTANVAYIFDELTLWHQN